MVPPRLLPPLIALMSSAAVVCAACGTGSGSAGPTGPPPTTPPIAVPLRGAPEPAVSPPAAGRLPGVIIPLAGRPEGLAVDSAGEVGVDVRAPDGLVTFPMASPQSRQFLATGGAARHLMPGAGDGLFLVPDETDDALVEVVVPAGPPIRPARIVASVAVGRQPHDAIAVGPSEVFVADELANTIHLVVGGKVVRVVKAPLQPGGMAANAEGTRALVVGVRGRRIAEYTAAGDIVGAANCGAGPTHAVTGDGGLYWVADTSGNAILGFEMGPGGPVQVATIPVGPRPYGLAFDSARDTLWVTLTGSNRLLGLRLVGSRVASRVFYDTVRQPDTVAVDQATGEVVVAGATTSGSLQLLDGRRTLDGGRTGA